jgi:hypothetical protein
VYPPLSQRLLLIQRHDLISEYLSGLLNSDDPSFSKLPIELAHALNSAYCGANSLFSKHIKIAIQQFKAYNIAKGNVDTLCFTQLDNNFKGELRRISNLIVSVEMDFYLVILYQLRE